MEPEQVITGTRVRVKDVLSSMPEIETGVKKIADRERLYKGRRPNALGEIVGLIPGIHKGLVHVRHIEDVVDGFFNGEQAAYFDYELDLSH